MKLLGIWIAGCVLWLADVARRQDDTIARLRTRIARLERQATAGTAWRTSPAIHVHSDERIRPILREISRRLAQDERPGSADA